MSVTQVAPSADQHAPSADQLTSLAFAPAPLPRRRRHLFVGTGFAVAGIVIYFATLFGIYFAERANFLEISDGQPWIPSSADLQLTASSMIVWTLLLSVITMQWSVYAAARQDRRNFLLAVTVTGIFGISIINQMAFIFIQMGLVIDDGSLAAPLIYTICGSFVALVAGAVIFLGIMAFRSLGGQTMSFSSDDMSAVALLWYAMVVIYFILWLGIFVAK